MRTPCALRACLLALVLLGVAAIGVRSDLPLTLSDTSGYENDHEGVEGEVSGGSGVVWGVGTNAEDLECPPLRLNCPHPDITFHLYTGSGTPTQLDEQNLWASAKDFVPGAPVKILLHDYGGNRDDHFNRVIRDGYFRRARAGGSGQAGAYNLVSVDWGELARAPCYSRAVNAVPLVGVCVARFASALAAAPPPLQRPHSTLHLLGYGLGAHVAGRAARCLAATGKIGRITGLDPAERGFESLAVGKRLSASDALFVDVMHTGSSAGSGGVAVGHVDFYVNGGAEQPACTRPGALAPGRGPLANASLEAAEAYAAKETSLNKDTRPEDYHFALGKAIARAAARDACSHALAPVYFAETLDSANGFWARPCPAHWVRRLLRPTQSFRSEFTVQPTPPIAPSPMPVLMGEDVPYSALGLLCVETRERAPFAMGRRGGTGVPAPSLPTITATPPPETAGPPPPVSLPPPPASPPASRSLFYDALGLVTAFFFFYLAVRYATASSQWKTKGNGSRCSKRRTAAQYLKDARLARWALHAVVPSLTNPSRSRPPSRRGPPSRGGHSHRRASSRASPSPGRRFCLSARARHASSPPPSGHKGMWSAQGRTFSTTSTPPSPSTTTPTPSSRFQGLGYPMELLLQSTTENTAHNTGATSSSCKLNETSYEAMDKFMRVAEAASKERESSPRKLSPQTIAHTPTSKKRTPLSQSGELAPSTHAAEVGFRTAESFAESCCTVDPTIVNLTNYQIREEAESEWEEISPSPPRSPSSLPREPLWPPHMTSSTSPSASPRRTRPHRQRRRH